jgi:tetratricopeptide (TPR) repeat protein
MKLCAATMGPLDLAAVAQKNVSQIVDGNVAINPGQITDFSRARNLLLEEAALAGYDWALMLDTDESIVSSPVLRVPGSVSADNDTSWGAIHDVLSITTHDVLMVPSIDETYSKERLFRLPARGHYTGPTHEAFILDDGASRGELIGWHFAEEPKTHEQYQAKAERDLEILKRWTKTHPEDPRWWYYLGDTRAGLGDRDGAIKAFKHCHKLEGWDEECAWAAFRVAQLYAEQASWDSAIHWCARGMEIRADFPELPWLAGWCCYQQGNDEQAIAWSKLAISHNADDPWQHLPVPDRVIFRYPPAHYEAPYDVIRWSLRRLGRPSDLYEALFETRLAKRQKSERRNARSSLC